MLIVSIALGLAGIAALLGLNLPLQITLSAMASIIGTVILRRMKGMSTGKMISQSLDIGQSVRVISWREDGVARVHYRGTEWDAELESSSLQRDGVLYIKAIQGSKLILTPYKPQQQ
ncbi:NfeD family protein [Candidatus Nitrotoga arctica]|nr:NfeD family protein [Candidatus Nitrotoga arctica]